MFFYLVSYLISLKHAQRTLQPGGKAEKRASSSSSTVLILHDHDGHFDEGYFEFLYQIGRKHSQN